MKQAYIDLEVTPTKNWLIEAGLNLLFYHKNTIWALLPACRCNTVTRMDGANGRVVIDYHTANRLIQYQSAFRVWVPSA
jgi:hypothetical protein